MQDVFISKLMDSSFIRFNELPVKLSRRELEIIQVYVTGHNSNHATADELFIAHKTLETHWDNIAKKFNMRIMDVKHYLTSLYWYEQGKMNNEFTYVSKNKP